MKSLETSKMNITTLRRIFARCCKILDLNQETCLNLTLLLQSGEEMETMVWALLQAEDEGMKLTRTEVVLIAEAIKEKYLEKENRE